MKWKHKMKRIKVLKGKNRYEVYLGKGTFDTFPELIEQIGLNTNILYIVDENVMKFHSEKINSIIAKSKGKSNLYLMPSGEKNKSTDQFYKIMSFMAENNYGRDSLIAAIGGGVTGDIAGFAASTYMRGVQLVQIPTTLLAMVDSSVGGKTGINFINRKNIIGTFYQPDFVLSDSTFLSTLPENELISGAGEIIKYAFLSNREFYNKINDSFDAIISLNDKSLDKIIQLCVKTKAEIVTDDEQESGLRKLLNLGHTFAHAYESYFDFKIKHGTAVAAGIISSLFISYQKGIINETSLDYLLKLPSKINYPRPDNPDVEKILGFMLSDKKNKEGGIRFVLMKDIGEIMIDAEAKREEIIYAIQRTFSLQSSV
jgi:3-dehydroquinate synthase